MQEQRATVSETELKNAYYIHVLLQCVIYINTKNACVASKLQENVCIANPRYSELYELIFFRFTLTNVS